MVICKMAKKQIKLALIDLSGTLHIEDTAILGAQHAVDKLRDANIQVKFVTNTSKESANAIYERLQKLGFNIRKEEMFSSLIAARDLIIKRSLNPYLCLETAAMEDFQGFNKNEDPNAVVIGLAPEKFNYDTLNVVFRMLMAGAPLIAVHEGRYYKRHDGLALGPGAFVRGLEYAANVKAEIVGKPNPEFFKAALGDVEPEEAIMIGDDVENDIAGARAVGIEGILVRTGKFRSSDEESISPPAFTCESIVQAVQNIITRK